MPLISSPAAIRASAEYVRCQLTPLVLLVLTGGIFPTSISDVITQRAQMRDIIYSAWPACTAPDPEHPGTPFRVSALSKGIFALTVYHVYASRMQSATLCHACAVTAHCMGHGRNVH